MTFLGNRTTGSLAEADSSRWAGLAETFDRASGGGGTGPPVPPQGTFTFGAEPLNVGEESSDQVNMSTGRLRSLRSSDEEGAVLIEFAIVIGLFFMLVFGMVDFGLAINTKTQMTNAGREGARLGTVTLDATVVEDRVRETAPNLDQVILAVTVTCEQPDDSPCPGGTPGDLSNGEAGDSVVVTIDYRYNLITPLPSFIDSDNKIDLKSVTEMRIE